MRSITQSLVGWIEQRWVSYMKLDEYKMYSLVVQQSIAQLMDIVYPLRRSLECVAWLAVT